MDLFVNCSLLEKKQKGIPKMTVTKMRITKPKDKLTTIPNSGRTKNKNTATTTRPIKMKTKPVKDLTTGFLTSSLSTSIMPGECLH